MRISCSIGISFCFALSTFGQSMDGVDTLKTQEINEVTVTAHKSGRMKANTVGNNPWSLDAEHSGVEGCLVGEEWLREHHRAD